MARLLTALSGLALLAVLLVVCLRTHPAGIEADIARRTNAQLERRGFGWAGVRVDGRDVTLEGTAGSEEERDAAARLAGGVHGVRTIDNRVSVATPEPALPPEPLEFLVTRGADELRLTGAVPDEARREALGQLAAERFPEKRIVNELRTGAKTPLGWAEAAEVGLTALAQLDDGELRVDGTRLTLRGEVADATRRAAVETSVADALPASYLSRLQIDVPGPAPADDAQVGRCQDEFDALMRDGRILFSVGSAEIDAASGALLTQLAELAARCVALIRVEGHTDAQGGAPGNLALSQRRADAVRDELVARGVDASRVSARGFGETRPIADNATTEGRARNRRIEFRVEKITP